MTISTLSSELACVECGVNCSRPVSSYSCLQAKNKKHEKRTSETYFSNSRAALDSNEALQLPLRASASSIALEAGGLRLSLSAAARFDIVPTPFRPSSVQVIINQLLDCFINCAFSPPTACNQWHWAGAALLECRQLGDASVCFQMLGNICLIMEFVLLAQEMKNVWRCGTDIAYKQGMLWRCGTH